MNVYINGKLANWYDMEQLNANLKNRTIEVINVKINDNLLVIDYIGR